MLHTEMSNPRSERIDKMSTKEMLALMQEENYHVVEAIGAEMEAMEKAVDEMSIRFNRGGRILYVGCGTSGRLGVVDAAELPPTYKIAKERAVAVMAGGYEALHSPSELTEDNYEEGYAALKEKQLTPDDTLIGISVAGSAAYVVGALTAAKEAGAYTIALTCNENTPIGKIADVEIKPDTGAEVVTGSTRMKGGSSHKMVLTMISTCVMIKAGRTIGNMLPGGGERPNIKVHKRRIDNFCQLTGCEDRKKAEEILESCGYTLAKAIELYHQGV